jgi:soluble lytic murein transglycosylase-like protein
MLSPSEEVTDIPRLLALLYGIVALSFLLLYGALWTIDITSIGSRLSLYSATSQGLSSNTPTLTTGMPPSQHFNRVRTFLEQHAPRSLSQEERQLLAAQLSYEGAYSKVDPLFVATIVRHESSFQKNAISHRGARGLMQLLPSTAEETTRLVHEPWRGPHALFDPSYNIRLGVAYLKSLCEQFDGNWYDALAAYNWGPGKVTRAKRDGRPFPYEVSLYASSILQTYKKWKVVKSK